MSMALTDFFVIGCNHRSAPIEFREAIALNPDQERELISQLLTCGAADEAAVLCTCSRIEILVISKSEIFRLEPLLQALANVAGVAGLPEDAFYVFRGQEALEHLFRVASSLDSQIIGETHILGQVKSCYQNARSCGGTGKWLNHFFQRSFNVAKKVRSETGITALPVSTGSCSVALAQRILETIDNSRVLVVGAGQTGETVARHFRKHGARMLVSNRTVEKARTLAAALDGECVDFKCWPSLLAGVDVAVFATGAARPLLTMELFDEVMRIRKNRPLLVLDLSVPRNVDPEVGQRPSAFLYDVDAVQGIVEVHYEARKREAEKAAEIIAASAGRIWGKASAEERTRKTSWSGFRCPGVAAG